MFKLKLRAGVKGDGNRTVPLSFKVTAKLVQVVGQSLVVSRVGSLKACTHQDEYRRALFASVFQRVFCVHTQAIFADDEPSEHANSFPDIRWRLM